MFSGNLAVIRFATILTLKYLIIFRSLFGANSQRNDDNIENSDDDPNDVINRLMNVQKPLIKENTLKSLSFRLTRVSFQSHSI
jgi:hypothetical protein